MTLTRRQALLAGAALPSAAALPVLIPAAAHAQAAAGGPARDHALGNFRVTSLLTGAMPMDNPREIYATDASEEDFAAVAEAGFVPVDRSVNSFTPIVVNTGAEVVLFDTGLSPEGIVSALQGAGYTPDDVTHIVLSHMHPDHIGGVMGADGAPVFGNARYFTGQQEFDFWATQANERFDLNVRPLAERFTFLDDGDTVVGGITATAAFGHTPGHMAFHLENEGRRLLFIADAATHYVFSLANPEWEVVFDADKAAAAATRRRLLDLAATDRIAIAGYHMPFPGIGFIETRGTGFGYVPASYQFG